MLPLLYISHRLAVHDDPWYAATWNFMVRPGTTLASCRTCRKDDRIAPVAGSWNSLRNGVFAPLRIFKALYSLGKMIGEDPNALQPTPVPLLEDAPGSAIDVQSKDADDLKDADTESTDSQLEVPASASQIYHAALVNGNTLDDILAAFEADEKIVAARNEHLIVHKRPAMPDQVIEQPVLPEPCKRHRYRSSSIQTTPERMLSTPKINENPPEPPLECEKDDATKEPRTPLRNTRDSLVRVMVDSGGENQITRSSPGSSVSCAAHDVSAAQGRDKRATSVALKRCPTFARRHNPPRPSGRSLSGEKRSLMALQERGTMSSPALPLGSPTKRARLQRKVKVFQDTDNNPDP